MDAMERRSRLPRFGQAATRPNTATTKEEAGAIEDPDADQGTDADRTVSAILAGVAKAGAGGGPSSTATPARAGPAVTLASRATA